MIPTDVTASGFNVQSLFTSGFLSTKLSGSEIVTPSPLIPCPPLIQKAIQYLKSPL